MARIEPIAWEELPEESRAMMESGTATGMYSTTVPLQIIAYSSMAMKGLHDQYEATFRKGVLEPRLVELLRLHSAQVAACEPCSASRKDESITEDDVACLLDPNPSRFTPREFAALHLAGSRACRGCPSSVIAGGFDWRLATPRRPLRGAS